MEMDRIVEPAPIQGDQNHSSPRARHHDRPIEVHRLVLMGDIWSQELDLRPFVDKVGESLRIYSSAGDIPDVMTHELECPLEIRPTASWLPMMSSSGYEVTTMTSWSVK